MSAVSFRGEAAESFANMLQHIEGYTVEVVPEDGAPFDGVVVGSAIDEVDDYFAVRVRRYDEETGGGVGEPFAVVVRELRVY